MTETHGEDKSAILPGDESRDSVDKPQVEPPVAGIDQLAEEAARGDSNAWNGLVQMYTPLVMSVIRQYPLGDREAADVAQTVWLRLIGHLPDVREPRTLSAWIETMTAKEALHLIETGRRTTPVNSTQHFEYVDEPAKMSDEQLADTRSLTDRPTERDRPTVVNSTQQNPGLPEKPVEAAAEPAQEGSESVKDGRSTPSRGRARIVLTDPKDMLRRRQLLAKAEAKLAARRPARR